MSVLGKKLLELLNSPKKRRQKVKPTIPPFGEAKTLGVVYTWGDSKKESALEELITNLGEDKQVSILCYNPTKEAIPTKHPSFDITSLSNLGKINSEIVQNFINIPFDYLFHFDFELENIVKSILVQTQAKCRVGLHSQEGAPYYELMIGINKSAGITNFAEQMVKYVKAMK